MLEILINFSEVNYGLAERDVDGLSYKKKFELKICVCFITH